MRTPASRPASGLSLDGRGVAAARAFYDALPMLRPDARRAMLIGFAYNFECFDHLFAMISATVQGSMEDGDYAARARAVQLLLRPFCSEYGIEPGRPLARTHRELFADFFRAATGEAFPSRYPAVGDAWLELARRWAGTMRASAAGGGRAGEAAARYALGYLWAVERLSVDEMELMRSAWGRLGVSADYLEAHCAVEDEHSSCSDEAVAAFGAADHEAHFEGFYSDALSLAVAA
jgi:hypothetical protein